MSVTDACRFGSAVKMDKYDFELNQMKNFAPRSAAKRSDRIDFLRASTVIIVINCIILIGLSLISDF